MSPSILVHTPAPAPQQHHPTTSSSIPPPAASHQQQHPTSSPSSSCFLISRASSGQAMCECRFALQLTGCMQCREMSTSCHTCLGTTDGCSHGFHTPTTSPCTGLVYKAAGGTDAVMHCISSTLSLKSERSISWQLFSSSRFMQWVNLALAAETPVLSLWGTQWAGPGGLPSLLPGIWVPRCSAGSTKHCPWMGVQSEQSRGG